MENDQLQQNKLGGLPAVWRNWREKTRSWKSLDALPTIPVMAENLEVLDSPRAYRETLLALIASARHRILLAALYLQDDDGGREVLGALYAAKAARPELEIAVFVDWHRAQRGLIGKAKSAGNAAMYREMAQRLGSGVKIYGVPVQRRELLGVMHLKGFIIDDTVLFSSPCFWRGKKMYSPDSEAYLKNPEFWEKMNNGWDEFSIPKEVARSLIAMHVKRGDSIFFVTGRSQTKTETVSKTLQDDFLIPAANMNPVIFAGDKPGQNTKTQWLQEKGIKVFYGDSDNDITAAREAGARGIRVLRAANSSYKPLPMAGALGEEVIVNSEY